MERQRQILLEGSMVVSKSYQDITLLNGQRKFWKHFYYSYLLISLKNILQTSSSSDWKILCIPTNGKYRDRYRAVFVVQIRAFCKLETVLSKMEEKWTCEKEWRKQPIICPAKSTVIDNTEIYVFTKSLKCEAGLFYGNT